MDGRMSRAEARAIWLKHVFDPDGVPPPQLARARNALIKKMHPDAGGNPEDAKLINAAYDVLRASSLDEAARQRQEWEQKRRQWELHQHAYNDQRERERRYQAWVEKRAAERQAEAPAAEEAAVQHQAEVQPRHRWSIARLCHGFVARIASCVGLPVARDHPG